MSYNNNSQIWSTSADLKCCPYYSSLGAAPLDQLWLQDLYAVDAFAGEAEITRAFRLEPQPGK